MAQNYGGVRLQNLITIGSTNMIRTDGTIITAKDNLAVNYHPSWSYISDFEPARSNVPSSSEPDRCAGASPIPANPQLPQGSYVPYLPDAPINGSGPAWDDGRVHGWFTLVNGTPYKWKLNRVSSHQVGPWKFYDVPSGK